MSWVWIRGHKNPNRTELQYVRVRCRTHLFRSSSVLFFWTSSSSVRVRIDTVRTKFELYDNSIYYFPVTQRLSQHCFLFHSFFPQLSRHIISRMVSGDIACRSSLSNKEALEKIRSTNALVAGQAK